MTRISDAFVRLSDRGERALISYVMAGYPDERSTLAAVRGMVRGGADVIELGFPFSDPLADGPAIQEAATVSLEQGTTLESYYSMVRSIREFTGVPLVMMTYSNVAYSAGYGEFVSGAVEAGIDGFILPDMPVEESAAYRGAAQSAGADTIFLASPNTTPARAARIIQASTGFLYMVAVYGTTGARSGVQEYAVRALSRIKGMAGELPVGIGFGVSGPADVRRYVEAGADAVISGSAFLGIMRGAAPGEIEGRIASFAGSLKAETLQGPS